MSMKDHVVRFVAHKRSLGCKYADEERLLLSWADAAMASGDDVIRADAMVQWARQTSSNKEARKRLAAGRRLALWLHAGDERHEIPHLECLGRTRREQRAPILLSDDQILMLIEAALQLPPAGSITPHTMHCIIGLIAVTGLRRTEACSLRLSDLTSDGLVVRKTKFGKSRLVPLSGSTRDALHRYLGRRKKLGAASDHLFVVSTGKPVSPNCLTRTFIKLARTTGLRGGKGEAGVTLRDLRHRLSAVFSKRVILAVNRAFEVD
ncbi:MAG: tyrosine-type recombinase/integrase [Gemmatimonadota bacterium]|nr:tyrosine-type recombinase/integrase [Gemmatimonadota bacterium]